MRKVLVVSPHFDDAVLSAGQFLAGRPHADVVTVFGGYPENAAELSTPYDLNCGFNNALDAVSIRRIEDDTALGLLNCNSLYFEFVDEQYREEEANKSLIKKELMKLINKNEYEFIIGPVGLGHPDHQVVSEVVRSLDVKLPIFLYEDLPLRVVYPELMFEAMNKLNLKKRAYPGDGEIAKKIRALSCYESQIGTGILDPFVMYVPERFWHINDIQ